MKRRVRTKRKPPKRYKKYKSKSIKHRIIGGQPGTEDMDVKNPEDLLYKQKEWRFNRVDPTECRPGHYAKMGIDEEYAAILQGHTKAKTRPPNHVLEKLNDRNDPKGSGDGVCFEDFNSVLKKDPVVYLVGHGSIKRGPSVHLPKYDAFVVNFNQSGMVGMSNMQHTRKTDEGELVDLPHDMRGFLKNIVGNQNMTSDDMTKYHFFKPGRELVTGDPRAHEVKRNFHYIPSCANNEWVVHWDLGWVNSMHLLTSDCGVYRGHVGKNIFSWLNPKVYGGEGSVFENITSGEFSWNYAEGDNDTFINKKTESGIYIFNEDEDSLLTDQALDEFCANLKSASVIKVDGSNRDYSVDADIVWELGMSNGLKYLHIFTKPKGKHWSDNPRMILWTAISNETMLDCFKKLFNRPFTLIDTVCRSSFSNDIGDNTADMARQISTRTRVPGGIPDDRPSRQGQQAKKNTLLYVNIKVPPGKHLHVGDRLAIFKSDETFTTETIDTLKRIQHNPYDAWLALHSAHLAASSVPPALYPKVYEFMVTQKSFTADTRLDTRIYPFTITADHIKQVRPDVSGGLLADEIFDVQIDTSETSARPLSEWIKDLTPAELLSRSRRQQQQQQQQQQQRPSRFPSKPRNTRPQGSDSGGKYDIDPMKQLVILLINKANELGIEKVKIDQATSSTNMADKYLELKKLIPDKIEKEVLGKWAEEEEDRGIYAGGYRKKLSRKKRKRIKKTKRFKHKKKNL